LEERKTASYLPGATKKSLLEKKSRHIEGARTRGGLQRRCPTTLLKQSVRGKVLAKEGEEFTVSRRRLSESLGIGGIYRTLFPITFLGLQFCHVKPPKYEDVALRYGRGLNSHPMELK